MRPLILIALGFLAYGCGGSVSPTSPTPVTETIAEATLTRSVQIRQ